MKLIPVPVPAFSPRTLHASPASKHGKWPDRCLHAGRGLDGFGQGDPKLHRAMAGGPGPPRPRELLPEKIPAIRATFQRHLLDADTLRHLA